MTPIPNSTGRPFFYLLKSRNLAVEVKQLNRRRRLVWRDPDNAFLEGTAAANAQREQAAGEQLCSTAERLRARPSASAARSRSTPTHQARLLYCVVTSMDSQTSVISEALRNPYPSKPCLSMDQITADICIEWKLR